MGEAENEEESPNFPFPFPIHRLEQICLKTYLPQTNFLYFDENKSFIKAITMCTIHNIVKVLSDSTNLFWIFINVLEWNLNSKVVASFEKQFWSLKNLMLILMTIKGLEKKYKQLHSSLSFWWQWHFPSWMKEILEREIAFLWMSKRGLLLILWQHATCVQKLYLHLWEARHLLRNMFDTEFYFVFLSHRTLQVDQAKNKWQNPTQMVVLQKRNL